MFRSTKLLTLPTGDFLNRDNSPVGVHLVVMAFAVSVTAAVELLRFATFNFAVRPLAKNITRLVRFGVKHYVVGMQIGLIAVLESYVHRLTLRAIALWDWPIMFLVGEAMPRYVSAVNFLRATLARWSDWMLGDERVAVRLPAPVVHSAPATAMSRFLAAFNRAGKAGTVTLGSCPGTSTWWSWIDSRIAVIPPAEIVSMAKAALMNRLAAIFNNAECIHAREYNVYGVTNQPILLA